MTFASVEPLPALSPLGRKGRGARTFDLIKPVLPLVILIYSFLLFSPEVRFQLLGLSLPLYRIIAIGFAWRWIGSFSNREVKFSAPDLMITVASVWMIVSFSHNYGFASGFVRGMGVVIDTAGSYFIARACIRTPSDLRLLILLLVPVILLAGIELLLESLRKDFIVRPFFAKIFGPTSAYTGGGGGWRSGASQGIQNWWADARIWAFFASYSWWAGAYEHNFALSFQFFEKNS